MLRSIVLISFLMYSVSPTQAQYNNRASVDRDALPTDFACKKTGNAVRSATVTANTNDFRVSGNTVVSVVVENRVCQSDSPFQWKLSLAVDRIDTAGEGTSGARVGLGGHYWWNITPPGGTLGINSSVGVGATAYFGYEDYSFIDYRSSPTGVRVRGKRAATIIDGFAIYTIENRSATKRMPLPDTALRLEGHIKYIDKHAPDANLPAFLDERFVAAAGHIAMEVFVPNSRHGNKFEVGLGYERFLTDRYPIHGIASARLQWRPQWNPDRDLPDKLHITLGYQAAKNYSGVSLGVGTTF